MIAKGGGEERRRGVPPGHDKGGGLMAGGWEVTEGTADRTTRCGL